MTAIARKQLQKVPNTATADEVLAVVQEDGGVIIERFITAEQVRRLNDEIDPHMARLAAGSTHDDEFIADFHGASTKRLTNLVTHSKTFREELLTHPVASAIADAVFLEESGTYWMNTAQVIEIGPGNKAQMLHRDGGIPAFVPLGKAAPEIMINFLVALTDFTEANGATRVIPGSNHWDDFSDFGSPEMTVPAEMNVGDVLFINGKVVHGGGANTTADFRRRGLAWTFSPGYIVPEEAYPFMVDIEIVRTLPQRAQRLIGFRSQYPKGVPGLWQWDYSELADHIGL